MVTFPCPSFQHEMQIAKENAKPQEQIVTPPEPPKKMGRPINPRNDQGWMIPKEGTEDRKVYDLLMLNTPVKDIATATGRKPNACHQAVWRIKNPEAHAKNVNKVRNKNEASVPRSDD